MLNTLLRMGMQQAYGPAAEKVREAMLRFFRSCPLGISLPGGILICHSIPDQLDTRKFDKSVFYRDLNPMEFYEHGDIFRLLWGRDHRPENARAFAELMGARVLLCGHDPCPEGYSVPNIYQIILDCCGEKACYVILPVGEELRQQEIVGRIQRLK